MNVPLPRAGANSTATNPDPVCVFHGLRQSEHLCLVCCLCFSDMTLAEAMDTGEDVCISCKEQENRE